MYDAMKLFCQPYLPLMLLLGVAVLSARRAGRLSGRHFGMILSAWTSLIILSVPLTGFFLAGTLEWRYLPAPQFTNRPEAILVLGGGLLPKKGEVAEADLNASSYKRVLHAWRLYQKFGGCPMVLCGGATAHGDPRSTEAGVMREFLIRLGVPETDIVTEGRSLSTYENAVLAAEILREKGWERPILATEAMHMLRARLCFEKQGLKPIPAPCGFQAERLAGPAHKWIIPKAETLDLCQSILNEWMGLGYYRLCGRI